MKKPDNAGKIQEIISLARITLNYRPEIDGLRAIAVLIVFIFHLSPKLLPGGFIGVDVFFVISGFLITTVLLLDLEKTGSISLRKFYKRRIQRIIPPLFVLLAITWTLGFLFFLPEDFERLAASGVYVLGFISNLYFGRKADYFAPSSDEFPLLHTWSLAIEEQFYFFWPLLLLVFRKNYRAHILKVLVLIIVSSILFAQFLSTNDSFKTYSYFSFLARAGELGVGALVAILCRYHNERLLKLRNSFSTFTGLLLIGFSSFYFSKSSVLPGFGVIIPCLGASLIIISGSNNPIAKILSVDWLREIGKHSYSIYLYHWPIIAFIRYLNSGTAFSLTDYLIIFGFTILGAMLSKRYVEDSVYKIELNFSKAFLFILIFPLIFFRILFFETTSSKGMPERVSNYKELKEDISFPQDEYCYNSKNLKCDIIQAETDKALLFGDSHAAHYAPYWAEVFRGSGVGLFAKSIPTCPPLLVRSKEMDKLISTHAYPGCIDMLNKVQLKIEEERNGLIILSFSWCSSFTDKKEFLTSLEDTLKYLEDKNQNVLVTGAFPFKNKQLFQKYIRNKYAFYDLSSSVIEIEKKLVEDRHCEKGVNDLKRKMTEVLKRHPKVTFFDPLEEDLEVKTSLPFYDSRVMYKDGGHLNLYSSQLLGLRGKKSALEKLCTSLKCKK